MVQLQSSNIILLIKLNLIVIDQDFNKTLSNLQNFPIVHCQTFQNPSHSQITKNFFCGILFFDDFCDFTHSIAFDLKLFLISS